MAMPFSQRYVVELAVNDPDNPDCPYYYDFAGYPGDSNAVALELLALTMYPTAYVVGWHLEYCGDLPVGNLLPPWNYNNFISDKGEPNANS